MHTRRVSWLLTRATLSAAFRPVSLLSHRLTIPQHVGIRNALHGWEDEKNDAEVGFHISYAEDIEDVGYQGIVDRIWEIVGDNPVYITLDIDVLDPSFAPAYVAPIILQYYC